jgi:hypothetical protein
LQLQPLTGALKPSVFADPVRGEEIYRTPLRRDLLICADCHSDEPRNNNFGNIWAGRNAAGAISRAVSLNTGGMGYFSQFFNDNDYADIAAYLGQSATQLSFGAVSQGRTSAAQRLTVSSSTKVGLQGVSFEVQGPFRVLQDGCGAIVARFSSCAVDLVFEPRAGGDQPGALLIRHSETPAPILVRLSGTGN